MVDEFPNHIETENEVISMALTELKREINETQLKLEEIIVHPTCMVFSTEDWEKTRTNLGRHFEISQGFCRFSSFSENKLNPFDGELLFRICQIAAQQYAKINHFVYGKRLWTTLKWALLHLILLKRKVSLKNLSKHVCVKHCSNVNGLDGIIPKQMIQFLKQSA